MATILAIYAVSLLLIFGELFLPSAVLAVVGIGGLAGSIAWAWRTEGWPTGLGMLVLAVVIVPAVIVRAARRLTLEAQVGGPGCEPVPGILPGTEGKAVTPLRPTGVALIDGKRMDVLTNGEPVDRDAAIRVVSVEGNRVVVAPVERRIG